MLDVASFLAGPFAATQLAEFGAEVIKVELPGVGDATRRFGTMTECGDTLPWRHAPPGSSFRVAVVAQRHFAPGEGLVATLAVSRIEQVIADFRRTSVIGWITDTRSNFAVAQSARAVHQPASERIFEIGVGTAF